MTPKHQSNTTHVRQLSFLDRESEELAVPNSPEPPPVDAHTTLSVARIWFKQHLQDQARPHNTIESYIYDLVVLENRVSDKPIHRINETDIALFLGDATSKATRKRHLTSLKSFFGYLVEDLKVLKIDPTSSFSPHRLELNPPEILNEVEQDAMISSSLGDEPWSAPAIWLMMRLGLGRAEILGLKRDHVDRLADPGPEILVAYDAPGKLAKQRILLGNQEFAEIYARFLEQKQPADVLFPYGPQAVNGMVERVASNAGIRRKITPQLLRQTAAVETARTGKSVNQMLALLGMANDARNRETVRMFIQMAETIGMIATEEPDS